MHSLWMLVSNTYLKGGVRKRVMQNAAGLEFYMLALTLVISHTVQCYSVIYDSVNSLPLALWVSKAKMYITY